MVTRIDAGRITMEDALKRVGDPSCGGVAVFLGVVRDNDKGRAVTAIEYHAYPEMARKVLDSIEAGLRKRFPVGGVLLRHRTGKLKVGEASVVVAVSSPHRAEAFAACREGIERIKAELPVWKKEFGRGGAVWKEEQDLRRAPSARPRRKTPVRTSR
jgi:molybdopterin synthase catalytic subunit